MSVIGYEAKKILIKQYALCIMLFVIAAELVSLPFTLESNHGFKTPGENARYLEMIRPFSGTPNESKEEKITQMYEDVVNADSQNNLITAQLLEGLITEDEAKGLRAGYTDTLQNSNFIRMIFERYGYASADPEKRMILPVSDVSVMYSGSANYLFLIAIAFCGAFAILIENNSKSFFVLKTTPDGQRKTARSKLIVLLLATACTSAALSFIDLIKLSSELPPEYWSCTLCSLERYANSEYDLTIIGAFGLVQLLKMLGYLLVGAMAMLTAHFTKNYVAAIFPYAAVPVIADYVADRDSQAYFLPTGLIKGYGYFWGELRIPNYEEGIMFHKIPGGYLIFLIFFSIAFIAVSYAVIIQTGKNRLMKNNKTPRSVAAFIIGFFSVITLTSCRDSDSLYGDGVCFAQKETCENSRYIFSIRTLESGSESSMENSLYFTDKESGKTEEIPFSAFSGYDYISSIFATEKYLYYVHGSGTKISGVRLSDMTHELIFSNSYSIKKNALGLTFEYGEEGIGSISRAVSDGKNIYFSTASGVFRLNAFGNPECVIEGYIYDFQIDERYVYYTDAEGYKKVYDISKGEIESPAEIR